MIVNNLGGTSCLELYIIANSAIRYLGTYNHFQYYLTSNNFIIMHTFAVDRLKLNVVRVYVGSLMTSLEMAGVSLTLLHMVPGLQWEEFLGNLNTLNMFNWITIELKKNVQMHPQLPVAGQTLSLATRLKHALSQP